MSGVDAELDRIAAERAAADAAYRNALIVAQAEYDELEPQLTALQDRAANLKTAMKGLAHLLASYDDMDDKYKFMPRTVNNQPSRSPHHPSQRGKR